MFGDAHGSAAGEIRGGAVPKQLLEGFRQPAQMRVSVQSALALGEGQSNLIGGIRLVQRVSSDTVGSSMKALASHRAQGLWGA
jgi:uncharacterized protein (DUF2344 family)